MAAVQKAHPDVLVQEHGAVSERKALGATERADEAKSQQISMAGTLTILLLVFGAAVAAGVPLLLGITAFVATTGLLGPISQLAPLHEAVQIVTMLIGLAVGVDYAMFYMRRSLPASVVVKAKDVTAPEIQTAIKQLHDKAIATGELSEPSSVTVNPDKTVAMMSLSIKGKGTDAASERSLEVLRDDVVPATVGKLQNAEVAVGGMTAWSKDFIDTMKSHLPIVFGFVLAMAFILLLVTFRSIVVPIKAIILNLLSVGSAYGIPTLVFQDGHGEKALGFTSVGGITPWLPLFLFVVLFGCRWTTTCSSSARSASSSTAGCRPNRPSPRASRARPA